MTHYDAGKYRVLSMKLRNESFSFLHVVIMRKDKKKIKGFRTLQRVKDMIFPNQQAIQVFPKKSDLVDNANVYHLWILEKPLDINLTQLENYTIEN